ncbi:MAG: DUF3987 domain-containing protein, partial [Bacteroidota bacterium]
PAQVFNLIPNAENGLFSRFGFYAFEVKPKMKDVFAHRETDYEEAFKSLSEELRCFYQRLEQSAQQIVFDFGSEQKQRFLDTFNEWHDEFFILLGKGSIASIRRLGLIHFRLAMILSVLRSMEMETLPEQMICSDEDFDNALQIITTLKGHAAKIFSQFAQQKDAHQFKGKKLQLFKMLPEHEFSRSTALEMANKLQFPRATFDRFLKSEAFEKIGHGTYRKRQ